MVKSEDILLMQDVLNNAGLNPSTGHSYKMYALRKDGHTFTFNEHVEAMVLSLLSANRPWKQIEENIDNLRKFFHDYDAEYLATADPVTLTIGVRELGCGNKAIARQMEGLSHNVRLMQRIENIIGNIDNLAANNDPYDVSMVLSSGVYKLQGFAQTLALQYLRNVGIDTCKPDVHIRRILARLGLIPYEDCPVRDVVDAMSKLGSELDMPITLVNEIIWFYGATGFGEVCGKTPKCILCNIVGCPSRH